MREDSHWIYSEKTLTGWQNGESTLTGWDPARAPTPPWYLEAWEGDGTLGTGADRCMIAAESVTIAAISAKIAA